MRIKSITLNNIGCFNGSNHFDLTTSESQNLVLIEGEQGSGKSTICKALEYALYGLYIKTQDRSSYINNYVKKLFNDAANIDYNIEVVFNIENTDYTLIRGTYINDNEYLSELLILKCNGKILNNPQIILNKVYKEYPYEMFNALYIDRIGNMFDPNYFKSIFDAIFNIHSNSDSKYEDLLKQVSTLTNNILRLNHYKIIITNDFKIMIRDELCISVYCDSASNEQILLYVIYYSMIKISNNDNLVIFDDPLVLLHSYPARYLCKNILSNMSTQTLLLVTPSMLERAKDWNIEFDDNKINKRYVLRKYE